MQLILAIEPDRRQAAHLTTVVRKRVHAELILVSTTAKALDAIGNRVPDLVLVPALLSPQDDAALAQALRVIAAAANVQMLTIPVLGAPRQTQKSGGVFSALRRSRKSAEPDGCDPDVFAEQILSYLERAALERGNLELDEEAAAVASEPRQAGAKVEPVAVATAPAVVDPPPADFLEPAVAIESAPPEDEPRPADFIEPPAALEPSFGVVADESVSLALEEAVRGLFSDSQLAAEEPLELPVSRVEPAVPVAAEPEPAMIAEAVASEPFSEFVVDEPAPDAIQALVEAPVVEAVPQALTDAERAAVDELVAALEQAPLAAIEAPEQADWTRSLMDAKEPARIFDKVRTVAVKPKDEKTGERKEPAVVAAAPPAPVAAAPPAPVPVAQPAPVSVVPPAPVSVAPAAAVAVAAPEAAAPPPHAEHQPAAAKSEREWIALIESLRADVERLRNERADKPAAKQAPPKPAPRAAKPKKPKPVQDEWGFFDPEQCGFAALLAKLEEVTEEESTPA